MAAPDPESDLPVASKTEEESSCMGFHLPASASKMTPLEVQTHLRFMREALAMAQHALSTSETPVGCVLVHAGTSTVIGRGANATNVSYNGTRHAEFVAVNQVLTAPLPIPTVPSSQTPSSLKRDGGDDLRDGREEVQEERKGESLRGKRRRHGAELLRECDLYVTIEPCIMCASLLRQFGIRRVFYGAVNEKFGGTGGVLRIQRENGRVSARCADSACADAGAGAGEGERGGKEVELRRKKGDYEVFGGWLREEAIVLLRRFYVQGNERAPEPARGKRERVLKLVVD